MRPRAGAAVLLPALALAACAPSERLDLGPALAGGGFAPCAAVGDLAASRDWRRRLWRPLNVA
ncbi:MAG: hypothetical protein ACRD0X_04545, partial [Thermoanaerobaculia bacterium]